MVYNSNEIQEIIPHRYPFLLVDRIDYISEDKTEIVGIKCVSANEMQFMGHFPNKHVMPGVLIVEALAQTGDVILIAGKGHEPYQEIEGVKHHFDDHEEVRAAFGIS